eukprot:m.211370 g.211370  ORF g.211370 m.211370 type:complete len:78 (+) comp25505_c0_seq4:1158-1391(+)
MQRCRSTSANGQVTECVSSEPDDSASANASVSVLERGAPSHDGRVTDHLGVELRVDSEQARKMSVVAVCPLHHRCNG